MRNARHDQVCGERSTEDGSSSDQDRLVSGNRENDDVHQRGRASENRSNGRITASSIMVQEFCISVSL